MPIEALRRARRENDEMLKQLLEEQQEKHIYFIPSQDGMSIWEEIEKHKGDDCE